MREGLRTLRISRQRDPLVNHRLLTKQGIYYILELKFKTNILVQKHPSIISVAWENTVRKHSRYIILHFLVAERQT